MAILDIKCKRGDRWKWNEIDLTGPHGNVFYLMSVAYTICKSNGIGSDHITNGMKADSYENALMVFDMFLGCTFTLYCSERQLAKLKQAEFTPLKMHKSEEENDQ